jgi:Flp pilus assembly pilin Flp
MKQRAQSFIEYAILITVVATALVAMGLYVRRSVQSQLKLIEQQVNVEAVRQ